MEFRVLEYFLAVTRAQSISAAAKELHLSQPTLSRQLKELEEEFGKQLFIRGNRKITLTQEGILLRKRAEEIVDLVQRTENEIMLSDETITGDIFIGTGETEGVRLITRAAKELQKDYPGIHYHIASGDAIDVIDRIDSGLLDFGILLEPVDLLKYNYLQLPVRDIWGVLMRRDSPLADKEYVAPEDLWNQPLILSRQAMNGDGLSRWLKREYSTLNIIATYNLVYNASLMVDEGLGYALCLDKLINTTGDSNLLFKPLHPELSIGMYIVWKKYQVFSKAAEKFLWTLQEVI